MTPLSSELQSLKEAASAATAVESAARALSARIFVECGKGGWLAMAREFSTIRASMALPEERYAAEIAALKNEDAVVIQSVREEAPCVGEFLTADQVATAPNGTCVYHATDSQDCARKVDGRWIHASGRKIALRGDKWVLRRWGGGDKAAGLGDTKLGYTIPPVRETKPAASGDTQSIAKKIREACDARPKPKEPSRPGDRLTAEQLRDAPNGTIVDKLPISGKGAPFVKSNSIWFSYDGKIAASGLGGECKLILWGRA